MKDFDIFDFEQQIYDCWGVTKDIRTVYGNLYEDDVINNDQFGNAMVGLETLYEMKFNELWKQFEDFVREYHGNRHMIKDLQNEVKRLKCQIEDAGYTVQRGKTVEEK